MVTATPSSSEIYKDLGLVRPPDKKAQNTELGLEQFLKLMTAQLNNQDPFEPMDNSTFLSQVAQFGTVKGIQDLQASFQEVSGSLQSNQALQASGLVGRSVLVSSAESSLEAGGSIRGAVELPSGAASPQLKIFDQAGQLVRTVDLGADQTGTVQFTWDGFKEDGTPATPGRYQFKVEGVTEGGAQGFPTFAAVRVDSVVIGEGSEGLTLNLAGQGSVPFSQIKQIL
ncbi:flagellar hook assembly protein FlgD [Nitrosococcus oceani]|uniref:flagellar hook assembly protein FlgD n=1 Tax=Nitrosococcus oceani TaxID=1229 RepID=UPI0004E96B71|nr:flagellar hook assembly protein FlgD [Nitrosococcus oceani]KFI21977.1 flagellar hook capping protein [Nitrosococcus oceani]